MGMMADTVDIPQLGAVKKNHVIAVAGVGGGILAYAWWRARSAPDLEETAPLEPEDPYTGLTDGGAGGPVGGYDDDRSSDTESTEPRTNAEWSQLVAEKLAGSYEPQVIDAALGRYLGRQPLAALDVTVVRAAIARAGYPPVGGPYAVITGGDTGLTVAPSGVAAKQSADGQRITVTWGAVPGAASYHVFRSDQGGPTVAAGTSATLHHVDPGFTYKIQVAAVSSSGKVGPKSPQVSVKTTGAVLNKRPTLIRLRPATTSVELGWERVPGATQYQVVMDRQARGVTSSNMFTVRNLAPGSSHVVQVLATAPGSKSVYGPTKSFRTKR